MIDDSIEQFCKVLKVQGSGKQFRLIWIMERLKDLNLDLTDLNNAVVITDGFLARVRRVVMNDILRDIKYRARIPVPKSYQLVGVADEGTAYKKEGVKNVFTLEEGQIYGRPAITSIILNCLFKPNASMHSKSRRYRTHLSQGQRLHLEEPRCTSRRL
jgi:RNA dependent RNA polymerase